ncbi:hypothetical protein VNO77_19836 [Canavalia gladiata]|uniref:Uncharacterized protein n=1 Tax=Canavalia gladiata TaxID=3824 RepID=A0AAN9QPZ7_CANGL
MFGEAISMHIHVKETTSRACFLAVSNQASTKPLGLFYYHEFMRKSSQLRVFTSSCPLLPTELGLSLIILDFNSRKIRDGSFVSRPCVGNPELEWAFCYMLAVLSWWEDV